MGKRKSFIDKSKAVTFRLAPAVDHTPKPVGNPELVNVVEITDEELAEREKYGIYYADNYNYMSHLRAKDELPEFQMLEKTTVTVPESIAKIPTNIVEIRGKEIPLDFTNAPGPSLASNIDGITEIDPEVLEMLNEEENCMDDDLELEDNFLELAGGVDMPEGRRIFEEFRRNAYVTSDSELVEDEDMDDEDAIEEEDEDDVDVRAEKVPHSILKNVQMNPDKKELDSRFNEFYENMNNSDLEDEEHDEDEDPEVDDLLLDTFASDYQDEKNKNVLKKPDPLSKELTLKAFEKQESGGKEETEKIDVEMRAKRPRWDCESIVSIYSNLYNHPTVIKEPPKRKSRKSKKNSKLSDEEQMDVETQSVRTNRSVCTVRSRGETTDERKERKRAVKEERRERRSEKKTLKEMFKDEKKKSDAQRAHVNIRARPIS